MNKEPLIKFCFYEFHPSVCLFVFDRLHRRKWLYFSRYVFYFLFRFCPVLGCEQSTAYVAINSLRVRYTLAKANKVNSWAAFLAKPR